MEKTAKITRTTFKNEWKGTNGSVFYHDIELDNGDKGSVGAKSANPEKLNPGQSLTYTMEGTKIKAVATPSSGGGAWPKGGKAAPEPRIQMISFAMAYTKDLVVAGKVDLKNLGEQFEILYAKMISKL